MEEDKELYEVYRDVRDNKKVKDIFSVELGKELVVFLDKEVDKYDKKK